MPYAPGVVDNSGMIRAQGILGAAQSYGNGMQAISQGLQAKHLKDEQDQALLAKASSTEKFIKAHADIFGGDEVVKDMLATNPQESPLARYNRTATIMADRVTGMKMESEQQQIQQSKQQQAAQAFVMQQQQLKAQQDAAQRARFEQMMGGVSPGAGGGGQRWPGSGTGPWAGMPNGTTPGPITGDTPAIAPQGTAPKPDPLTAQALAYYKATGQVPNSNAMSTMLADNSRQSIADVQARARDDVNDERTRSREAIAAAVEARKLAELAAKNSPPTYSQHPETGIWMMTQNGQTQPLPGQVAKDPYFSEIDKLAKIPVKDGGLSEAQATAAKKKLIIHRGTFSPNGMQAMQGMIAQSQGGAPAAGAAPGGMPSENDFFGPATPSPAAGVPRVANKADYDKLPAGSPYIGPDGQMATKRSQ